MTYREYPPPAHLAAGVECFWTLRVEGLCRAYPVLPDGCVDILTLHPGEPSVVGTMTRPQYVDLPAGQMVSGVRFRPGWARVMLGIPASLLTDRSAPLADLPGLRPVQPVRFHKLIDWVSARHGCLRLDDLARLAGWSNRQLRRRFLEETGLGPKQFCRILRFRRAVSLIRQRRGDWAGLAVDCGYYDQAHLIREFRELAGVSPGAHVRFVQSAGRGPDLASGL